MTRLRLIITLLVLPSVLIGARSVPDLITSADAIVIARAVEWSAATTTSVLVTLRVEQGVLKGELLAGAIVVAVAETRGDVSVWVGKQGESVAGLWFLQQPLDPSTAWQILPAWAGRELGPKDLYYPVRPADIEQRRATLSEEDVVLAVAAELRSTNTHPMVIRRALGTFDSPSVRSFLREMSQTPQVYTSLVGFSELLRRGDAAALSRLKEYETTIKSNPDGYGQLVIQTIEGHYRNADAAAVHLLGTFANDRNLDAQIREAVAHALAAIHTQESLSYLVRLLDEDSPRLRTSGVLGLSFFANGIGIPNPADGPSMKHLNEPGPSKYRTAETAQYLGFDEARATEFVAFWRDWWLKNQGDFQ